ncbi:MAG: hypothetical protein IPL61_01905 [Myxococcales bacterium]|nr:hypothetical protein [Myxococcales bacterium]
MPEPAPPRPRPSFFRPDGTTAIERRGMPRSWRETVQADVYHALRRTTWTRLFLAFALVFFVINLGFAAILYVGDATIINARPGSFWDRFYFSVETLATIGYGYMAPGDTLAHWIVTVESLFGILITAVITGLVFAKFGTTTAKVLWARVAVVSYESGVPVLQFRMANHRSSAIVEATIKVALSWTERLPTGEEARRIYDLPLRRATSPMFALSWTAFHAIDDASPLAGATPKLLAERMATLLVTFTGIDDALATTVHTRHTYVWTQIEWHRRYVDVLHDDDEAGVRYPPPDYAPPSAPPVPRHRRQPGRRAARVRRPGQAPTGRRPDRARPRRLPARPPRHRDRPTTRRAGEPAAGRRTAAQLFAGRLAAGWMNSSSSCFFATPVGHSVIRSEPFWVFGNAITSRSESAPAMIIARRSSPSAMPPWGGGPYLNASSRNPNFARASSSLMPSALNTRACRSERWIRIEPPPTSTPLSTRS